MKKKKKLLLILCPFIFLILYGIAEDQYRYYKVRKSNDKLRYNNAFGYYPDYDAQMIPPVALE